MATTLRDFIAHREGEIRDQLKALKAELKELHIAKEALEAQDGSSGATKPSSPGTIKDMARFVLSVAADGLTSEEILVAIKESFGRDVDRTSLSPQLSRLKEGGEVVLTGKKWFLPNLFSAWEERMAEQALEEFHEEFERASVEDLL